MKKIILIPVLLWCLAGTALAQENGFFNHMAAGISAGTAGAGLELATTLGPSFQLRAGGSFMPPFSFTRTVSLPEHPGNIGSAKGKSVPVDAKATLHDPGLELLVDYFPAGYELFHFTLGVLYGPRDVVKVTNTTPLPDDYNTAGLDIDDYTVRATDNYINGYVGVNSFRPYVGVGIGRAVRPEKVLSFTADFGAAFWGKPGLYAPGEPLIGDWKDVRVTSEALEGKDQGLIGLAEKIIVYPMLNLHLFVRLF